MSINDNDPRSAGNPSLLPDPHGRAALLLAESLLHGLCENATLTAHDAIEIAERAVNVQLSQAEESEGDTTSMRGSLDLLSSILASLKLDDIGRPPLRPV